MAKLSIYILTVIAALAASVTHADVGGWKIHAIFGDEITNIIDTGSMVYYLASGNLYSYDKDADESEHYSKQTKLSDVDIDNIYYNYDGGYLFIAYANGNIDILYDSGKVVNVPDVYDADVTDKGINHVNFNGDYIYVAAEFGYAILNSSRDFEVTESHIWDSEVTSIAKVGDYLWLSTNDNLYYVLDSDTHHSLSSFTLLEMGGWGIIYPIDDDSFFYSTWGMHYVKMDSDGNPSATWYVDILKLTMFQPSYSGFVAIDELSPRNMIIFNEDGTSYTKTELPDAMQSSLISTQESDGSIWELSVDGIRHLKIEDGSTTVYSDYFKYNSSTISFPAFLSYNESSQTLLISNIGPSEYQQSYKEVGYVNTLHDGTWSDITPSSLTTIGEEAEGILKNPYYPTYDPDDPDTYYIGTWFEGVYKITGTEEVMKYDWTNSPLEQDWVCAARAIDFDAAGNLWVFQSVTTPKVIVLPKAKLSQTTVSASDWITIDVTMPDESDFRSQMMITDQTDVKLFVADGSGKMLVAVYDSGDPTSSSIQTARYSSGDLYDQDEKSYTWNTINCFAETTDGNVWMGTDNGVVEFNPANIFSSSFSVTRIKVPRNDGTNYADYLLSGMEVTAIAVDGVNRKWLGTVSNGIYLVSSDGSEILKHYTSSDSELPSDMILSICCDPTSNTVYVGTSTGLVEYYSDSSPAAESYSNVYAYPNPVTPDFTGDVTITGLMENSLVKIADAAGNVIRSLKSSGGMATWDGCYGNGRRVKTGVYFVLASQNENDTSSGVVTKILFIK